MVLNASTDILDELLVTILLRSLVCGCFFGTFAGLLGEDFVFIFKIFDRPFQIFHRFPILILASHQL